MRGKLEACPPTVKLHNVSKTFGGIKVLNRVDLEILPGKIYGLLGQNGCGKSTLIKILSGYHTPDEGCQIWLNGQSVAQPISPDDLKRYGISFVHQDLGLIQELSVYENWFLGEIATSSSWNIRWKEKKQQLKDVFTKYGYDINVEALVGHLGPVQKAMLAILRAVENMKQSIEGKEEKNGLLVLDEPTVFLPREEVNVLFSLVRNFTKEGISVLFVSHDIDEVKELTDEFTVLRDGKKVGEGKTSEVTKEEIIEMIIGKKLQVYKTNSNKKEAVEVDYRIENLWGRIVKNETFQIHKGEILGISGLVGSGFEEIPYLLFGTTDCSGGQIIKDEKKLNLAKMTPTRALKNSFALIPADRGKDGAIGQLTVKENLLMQIYHKFNSFKLNQNKMNQKADKLITNYEVYPANADLKLSQLSGGNQQKVILAKWMQINPKLLILHEPTQGVDIGARQQIYKMIDKAVREKGTTVICCSSDGEQLEQICDRVLIMSNGRIVKELIGDEINKNSIIQSCF